MKISLFLVLVVACLFVLVESAQAGRGSGDLKRAEDYATDNEEDDSVSSMESPVPAPAEVPTMEDSPAGPSGPSVPALPMGPGPAVTAMPPAGGATVPDELPWPIAVGGARALVTMGLPAWAKESSGTAGQRWGGMKTQFGHAVFTEEGVTNTRLVRFMILCLFAGAGLWRLIRNDAMNGERLRLHLDALDRMNSRIEHEREKHFRIGTKKGWLLSTLQSTWKTIEEDMRSQSLERIEQELKEWEKKTLATLSELGYTPGSTGHKRKRGDDDSSDSDGGSDSASSGSDSEA